MIVMRASLVIATPPVLRNRETVLSPSTSPAGPPLFKLPPMVETLAYVSQVSARARARETAEGEAAGSADAHRGR